MADTPFRPNVGDDAPRKGKPSMQRMTGWSDNLSDAVVCDLGSILLKANEEVVCPDAPRKGKPSLQRMTGWSSNILGPIVCDLGPALNGATISV